jgi:hypothetical protein
MSRFTKHGAIYAFEAEDTGQWAWVISEPVVWEVRNSLGEVMSEIVIPQYFVTDLGTVPWWARWLINPADPQCAKAWILHDYVLETYGPERQIECSGILYEALKALKIPKWKRKVQWLAVIVGIDRW